MLGVVNNRMRRKECVIAIIAAGRARRLAFSQVARALLSWKIEKHTNNFRGTITENQVYSFNSYMTTGPDWLVWHFWQMLQGPMATPHADYPAAKDTEFWFHGLRFDCKHNERRFYCRAIVHTCKVQMVCTQKHILEPDRCHILARCRCPMLESARPPIINVWPMWARPMPYFWPDADVRCLPMFDRCCPKKKKKKKRGVSFICFCFQ